MQDVIGGNNGHMDRNIATNDIRKWKKVNGCKFRQIFVLLPMFILLVCLFFRKTKCLGAVFPSNNWEIPTCICYKIGNSYIYVYALIQFLKPANSASLVNTGSNNGLLPDDIKPLSEPMLTCRLLYLDEHISLEYL